MSPIHQYELAVQDQAKKSKKKKMESTSRSRDFSGRIQSSKPES
jgi:hypothetical protein